MEQLCPIIICCPHCNAFAEIEKLNCGIFRHGAFILSGKQLDPHTPRELCETYVRDGLIHGCGGPFRVVSKDGCLVAEVCDYI